MQKWIYAGGILLLVVLVGFVAVPAVSDHLNDQNYLTTWHQADSELTAISTAERSTGQNYAAAGKLATNLSIRSKYWYDKLSPMPVSKAMQDSKNAQLQALIEEQAYADAMAAAMPKVKGGLADTLSSISDLRIAGEHKTRMEEYNQMANESLPK